MAWHDVAGSIGAAIILISYYLLQVRRISSDTLAYSALNSAGALLILFSLLHDFNLSAFIIEAFWLAISLIGIVRRLREPGRDAA